MMAALFLTTIALYSPAIGYPFVNYDDPATVYDNPHISKGLTADGMRWAFGINHWAWHPLTFVSHMIDCQIFGIKNAAGHHLVNILFHAANAVLLLIVLQRMTGSLWASALAAALFALHPLRVESVAWVTERKDVLSMFFGLLALWCYAGYAARPDPLRYAGVFVLLALGLMSKAMLVTFPFVLLLLDFWPLKRWRPGKKDEDQTEDTTAAPFPARSLTQLILEKLPLLALSAGSAVLMMLSAGQSKAMTDSSRLPIHLRLGNAIESYFRYIQSAVAPYQLSIEYPHPMDQLNWTWVGISFVVLAAITALAVWQWRRRPYLIVGWLWYLGTLVPMIGLVQSGDHARADRFTYFPMLGLVIMAAWPVVQWAKSDRKRRYIAGAACGVCLAALIVTSSLQLRHWRSSSALWKRALAVNEQNFRAHFQLATEMTRLGHPDTQILPHMQRAVQLRPDHAESYLRLAGIYTRLNRLDDAIVTYQAAVKVQDDLFFFHLNLGSLLAQRGRLEPAVVHLTRADQLKPNDPLILFNLAQALRAVGKTDQAIERLQHLLKIAPDHDQARLLLEQIRSQA